MPKCRREQTKKPPRVPLWAREGILLGQPGAWPPGPGDAEPAATPVGSGGETDFLTPKEAARILKVHYQTILGLIKSGQLPALRVGRSWRIRRSALVALPIANASPIGRPPVLRVVGRQKSR